MSNFSFKMRPVNGDGVPLEDGACCEQRMPDDCISVSGTTVTAYIKEPGRGVPYCFFLSCGAYDWIYDYWASPVSCFSWDPASTLYGTTGCWRCDGLSGYLDWNSGNDRPTFGGSLLLPTELNILIGYSVSSDPDTIITSTGFVWPPGPTPVTTVYDSAWNLIWDSTWGHYWIWWENSTVKDIRYFVLTGNLPVSSMFFGKIGIKRTC